MSSKLFFKVRPLYNYFLVSLSFLILKFVSIINFYYYKYCKKNHAKIAKITWLLEHKNLFSKLILNSYFYYNIISNFTIYIIPVSKQKYENKNKQSFECLGNVTWKFKKMIHSNLNSSIIQDKYQIQWYYCHVRYVISYKTQKYIWHFLANCFINLSIFTLLLYQQILFLVKLDVVFY